MCEETRPIAPTPKRYWRLLHHSDQGSTYASEDYRRVLATHGITCSMSRRGECYDNAAMESWFSTLKLELGERFESPVHAKHQLFDYRRLLQSEAPALVSRIRKARRGRPALLSW